MPSISMMHSFSHLFGNEAAPAAILMSVGLWSLINLNFLLDFVGCSSITKVGPKMFRDFLNCYNENPFRLSTWA